MQSKNEQLKRLIESQCKVFGDDAHMALIAINGNNARVKVDEEWVRYEWNENNQKWQLKSGSETGQA